MRFLLLTILALACGSEPEVRFTLPERACTTTAIYNDGPAPCEVGGRQVWVSAGDTEPVPLGAKWRCYSMTGDQMAVACEED